MRKLCVDSLVGQDQDAVAAELIRRTLSMVGQPVEIPLELSEELNSALRAAVMPAVIALRERERAVSTDALRMTLR